MLLRVAFAFVIALILLPHEPDLGLPRLPRDNVERVLFHFRDMLTTRISLAANDLRNPVPIRATALDTKLPAATLHEQVRVETGKLPSLMN